MKKFATVPFRLKVKRFIKKISESGIRIKNSTEIGFSRNKDITPDKKYTVGIDHFYSIKSILIMSAAAASAVLVALLAFRLAFVLAVGKKARKHR